MGSSGSGNFTDYSNTNRPSGTGSTGGTSGNDPCRQAFSVSLEEVAQCDFFVSNGAVPSTSTVLSLVFERRIFAVTESGIQVGALPTQFNYLAACLRDGVSYVGIVTDSNLQPFPFVTADFTPQ